MTFILFQAQSLPDYPQPIFGSSMLWIEQKKTLMVCGGADWTGPSMNECLDPEHLTQRPMI